MTRSLRRQAGVPSVRCRHTVPLRDGSGGRRPCKNWASPGTTVCYMHVGAAAHVRRKADERMTLAQVMQYSPRPLGEVLVEATHVADSLMRDLKTQVLAGGGPVDPDLLTRLVEPPGWPTTSPRRPSGRACRWSWSGRPASPRT